MFYKSNLFHTRDKITLTKDGIYIKRNNQPLAICSIIHCTKILALDPSKKTLVSLFRYLTTLLQAPRKQSTTKIEVGKCLSHIIMPTAVLAGDRNRNI